MRQWVNSIIDDGPKILFSPYMGQESIYHHSSIKAFQPSNKCGLNYSRDIAIYSPNGYDEARNDWLIRNLLISPPFETDGKNDIVTHLQCCV